MPKDQNEMFKFANTGAKRGEKNPYVTEGLLCSQGLRPHKQSDLFKLSISEFCYLITSGGDSIFHSPMSYGEPFFMSEVDEGSGEELIINPQ